VRSLRGCPRGPEGPIISPPGLLPPAWPVRRRRPLIGGPHLSGHCAPFFFPFSLLYSASASPFRHRVMPKHRNGHARSSLTSPRTTPVARARGTTPCPKNPSTSALGCPPRAPPRAPRTPALILDVYAQKTLALRPIKPQHRSPRTLEPGEFPLLPQPRREAGEERKTEKEEPPPPELRHAAARMTSPRLLRRTTWPRAPCSNLTLHRAPMTPSRR
jgi:hypothetical protein